MTETRMEQFENLAAEAGSISRLLDSFFDERKQAMWPLSLALTMIAVRKQAPQCVMTNRELADLVAARAIERGHNVMFDSDLLSDS